MFEPFDDLVERVVVDGDENHLGLGFGEVVRNTMNFVVEAASLQEEVGELLWGTEDTVKEVLLNY